MKTSHSFYRSWSFAYLFFTFYLIALLSPLLLQIVEPVWDANDFYYPSFTYLADVIREGRFPLWDPYSNCGDPFHADPQKFTLNPIAIFLGALLNKSSLGFVAFWALHWWWGGAGMMWLSRYFGATPLGALFAAATYTLSGFFVGNAQHTPYVLLAAWLPWIIGLADKAVARSQLWCALLSGVALGFCAMGGGYPALISFTGFSLALWLILRFIPWHGGDEHDLRPVMEKVWWIAGTLLLVLIILAAVWAPILNAFFVEGAGFTDRIAPLSPDVANFGSPFSYRAAISLVFPYATVLFADLPGTVYGTRWMLADLSMTNAYMGMLTIPLAYFWWVREGRVRRLWLVVFVLFMFTVSLGGQGGLRILLYYLLPPLRYMRYNAAFRLFWIFPLCLAAGLGFSYLIRHPEHRRHLFKMTLAWASGAILLGIAVGIFSIKRGFSFDANLMRLYLPGLIVVPVSLSLLWYWSANGKEHLNRLIPAALFVLVLADMGGHLYNNSKTVWSSGQGNIDFIENRLHKRTTVIAGEPGGRLLQGLTGCMNSQQIFKEPVVAGYTAFSTPGFNDILCNSRFAEVISSPVRFWISPGVERSLGKDVTLNKLSATGRMSPVPVFLDNPPASLAGAGVVPGSFGAVRLISYAPEKIAMTVDVPGSAGGFLASTERYAAGWKATIDGVPQKVWRSNLYFRGVFLPAGRHSVVWSYEPALWKPLVVLSYATIASSICLALLLMRRKSGKP